MLEVFYILVFHSYLYWFNISYIRGNLILDHEILLSHVYFICFSSTKHEFPNYFMIISEYFSVKHRCNWIVSKDLSLCMDPWFTKQSCHMFPTPSKASLLSTWAWSFLRPVSNLIFQMCTEGSPLGLIFQGNKSK